MSTTDHTATGRTESGSAGPRTAEGSRRPGLNWWQASAAGAVAATLANLVILLIGRTAGASFAVADGATIHQVTAVGVIIATVPPLVVGTVLAALLARWWPWVIRLAQVIGGGLALLTVAGPLTIDTDRATQLALALMHLVVAVVVVVALEAVRVGRRYRH